MSQEFMDPELLADFIIEAREHLESVEPHLLELEKTPGNLALLNEIFRPMHSLKGASGFLGLAKMNSLAHKAENILDDLRKGTMAVNPEIMDSILACTDALRQIIDNLEASNTEGDVDTSHLVSVLDSLMAGQAPAGRASANAPPPDAAAPLPEEPAPAGQQDHAARTEASPAAASPVAGTPVRQGADAREWLANRAKLPAYTLTAFGEGHLRDFVEEAYEYIASLSDGLVELEKKPDEQGALVNDLFRYFHNLKGNSGIIAFQELNSLTHEVETLLNFVRKGEYGVTPALVDLLLLVVDAMEVLIHGIDPASGQVSPFDITELLDSLRRAVAGEPVSLPQSLLHTDAKHEHAQEAREHAPQPAKKLPEAEQDDSSAADREHAENLQLFKDTLEQQFALINAALDGIRRDGGNREYADVLFRSLTTIQSSCAFMGLEEIKVYAQRTAGIVDQGRASNMDFSILADLLEQECAIIRDLIASALAASPVADAGAPAEAPPEAAREADADSPAAEGGPAPLPPSLSALPQEPETVPLPEAEQAAPAGDSVRQTDPEPASPRRKQGARASGKKPSPLPQAAPRFADAQAAAANGAASEARAAAAQAQQHADAVRKASATIRVDHEKLDHLMNLISELIIIRNRYALLARHLERTPSAKDAGVIGQSITETTYSMARISDDLQDTIMKVRMVPVASVFSRFPRLVRDLARKSGKEVELIVEGEDTELDKSVVEVIGDPLVHLIRNSVDHGIEPEEERKSRGKPLKGAIWLRAFYKGNSVAIEIEDDGKGIDPEKMRDVAVRKGIISAEDARLLDDREARELIFAPGFSSAEVITDISGRGVGMDVVRTNIKNLKGVININSEVGKGTRFTLSLPLTLAIIDALMVSVDGQIYAIPLDAVSETTKIEATRLTNVKGRKVVTLRGKVLAVVSLREILGAPDDMDDREMLSVVVIQDNDRSLGLVVDRLLERQEIVIKPLGDYLGNVVGISGATILGDGSVILILDPHEIYLLSTSRIG